jgi:tetratricopeptide (TPR) repeat protein
MIVRNRTPEAQVPRWRLMRFWAIGLVLLTCLHARDEERLALSLKSQTDFERVLLAPLPTLSDTATCAQSQAAMISIGTPEEQPVLHYRKGYCMLAGASITRSRSDYAGAAAEFDRAIEAWPLRLRKPPKNALPEPVSSGVQVLSGLSRLFAESEAAAQPGLVAAVRDANCTTSIMPGDACRQWIEIGREWLGRWALNANNLEEAAADFANSRDTGWLDWVQGKQVFHARNYAQAAARYTTAINAWKAIWADPGPGFVRRMGPRPELSAALVDLGGAQMLSGNLRQAESTLDSALKADPASARAFYLRARTRELEGRMSDALTDYNLASRAAFAASEDLVSGEAHLYRGILLFRRKDYGHAEDEFASALNFSITDSLRPDAEAWRHLAAVASGSCATARQNLERSLVAVGPYFPKDEARNIASACPTTAN